MKQLSAAEAKKLAANNRHNLTKMAIKTIERNITYAVSEGESLVLTNCQGNLDKSMIEKHFKDMGYRVFITENAKEFIVSVSWL